MRKIAVVPTLLTLASGACGFASLTFASRVGPQPSGTEFTWLAIAGWLILIAIVLDSVDGHLARVARSASHFGAQLDSLCDVISFGVAPAFVLLRICGSFPGRMLWLIALLYVVCVVLRLARFNTETGQSITDHLVFRGLPSPAAAGTVAAFAILLAQVSGSDVLPTAAEAPGWDGVIQAGLPFGTLGLALLMVSRIPYPHVINQILQGHHRFAHIVKLVFAAVIIMLMPELSLPLIFTGFVLGAPLRFLWEEAVLRQPYEERLIPAAAGTDGPSARRLRRRAKTAERPMWRRRFVERVGRCLPASSKGWGRFRR